MIFWKLIVRMQLHKRLNARDLAPRARFELATLRLTAEMIENLSALSGVAYEKLGAVFPFLVAPNPAPTVMPAIGSHLPLTCRAGPNRKSLPRRNPRFYFSTTRFREIFPDPLCGGGPLHVARPVI